jgi:glyoxylase-like metal-dependent hydrolase (beta-lactamase superfamily II)
MHRRALASLLMLSLSAGALGCAGPQVVGKAPDGAPILQVPLRQSNAYLIRSKTPVLVDAGTLGDMDDLRSGLGALGADLDQVSLVVVTHAHHDHAGLARDLQRAGVRVMLGAGDVDQAKQGMDDDLKPTGLTGFLIKPLLFKEFPEVTPDIVVSEPVDLAPWGIQGKVLPMPGHTPGSLVVVLANHAAFVGDEMLGGWFAGAFFAHSPTEHYFQADPDRNHRNIAALVALGVDTFYLGHGGPVSRADVIDAFHLAR